jgi:hypothetical protein
MKAAMRYFISLEDGEIVKMTADGFESTGIFMVDLDEELPERYRVAGHAPVEEAA